MLRRLVLVTATLFLTTSSGCKQDEGERCQVTSDCADGLVCSASEPSICVTPGTTGGDDGGTPDAEDPIDSMPLDGPPAVLPQCSDGIDNETVPDALIDFAGGDPQCVDAADDDESA